MAPLIRRQLPNALTVLRLILAGAFFATLNAFRYPDHNVAWGNAAIVLFIAAVATDALDGYLARRWHVESIFGRIMDPFCDKVLIIGAFIYLAGPRFVIAESRTEDGDITVTMATAVYPWMVVVILARELLVTGIRGVIEGMGFSGASNWSGKAKMILQSLSVPLVMFVAINLHPSENQWAKIINNVLVYVTVIVTVWSGVPYITGLRQILLKRASESAST
jgi:CDP-diacylglycerol--glycerol-3-phosphate 3-phosphatidyltransferase